MKIAIIGNGIAAETLRLLKMNDDIEITHCDKAFYDANICDFDSVIHGVHAGPPRNKSDRKRNRKNRWS